MKKILVLLILIIMSCLCTMGQTNDSITWFKDAKLGLFLHWGLYSQAAGEWNGHPVEGGEHFMLYEKIPLVEYAKLADEFIPTDFDARRWVRIAKSAGMKYMVITAKHHDGFAMYESQCNDYNIVKKTPYAEDPMRELIEECHRQNMKFGFYYSLGRDWEDPDVPTDWPEKGGRSNTWDYPDEDAKQLDKYIKRKVLPQLKELLTNYGKIDFIWFDTPELVTSEMSEMLYDTIKSLQPECLVNKRVGNGFGDYSIVEQKLVDNIISKPWEACLTMGKNWGYNKFDTVYKSPDIIVRHLTDIVSKGGNMLLNIGPDGKGKFPIYTQPILDYLEKWLNKNGEAVYGTRPWRIFGEVITPLVVEHINEQPFHDAVYDATPTERVPDVRYTSKGNAVYAIVRHVPDKEYTLTAIKHPDHVASVEILNGSKKVKWRQTDDGLEINMSDVSLDFPIYVLKIKFTPHKLTYILDMVHNNPGEGITETKYNDPAFLKSVGYNGMVPQWQIQCALTYDSFQNNIIPHDSKERKWILDKREDIKLKITQAKAKGMNIYPFVDMLVLPTMLMEEYKDSLIRAKEVASGFDAVHGKLTPDISKPMTRQLIEIQMKELFETFPEIDGVVIRFGETYLFDTPYHSGGSPVPAGGQEGINGHIELINLLKRLVCETYGKKLFYRTWDFGFFLYRTGCLFKNNGSDRTSSGFIVFN